jgi:hypothetical protein
VWWVFEGSQGVGWNWTCVTGASDAIYRLEVSLNIRVDMVVPVLDFKKDVQNSLFFSHLLHDLAHAQSYRLMRRP